ncbi:MAG: septum formation initiator family protein [Pseudomonadota bacterium]|nr:septum formation initiator family protein [Pseudomonadota bacterium]
MKYLAESHYPFVRRAAGPLCIVLAMFYLGFHVFCGERGLLALFTESRRLAALTTELAAVQAERAALERKDKLLSDDSLDLDLLDEQARRELGLAGKDEKVYILHDETPAP